ncbi:MAG: PilT/PilU family type 4a pilus ATPase [Planctomycetes bacterium]|nr:PilT/PilU family type 4a pilus ATPase [Planctomycetota bacterium]
MSESGSSLSSVDQVFARIALKNNLVTQEQVKECMALVAQGKGDLGAVLQSKGYLSENHVTAIRRKADSVGSGGGGSASGAAPAAGKRGAPAAPEGSIDYRDVEKTDFSSLHGQPLGVYLAKARELGASDFHYQVDVPPLMRIHGHLVQMKHPVLTAEDTARGIRGLVDEEEWKLIESRNDYNLTYEREEHGRYRTNILRQRKGLDVIFRIIPDHIPTLEELHLPPVLSEFTKYRQGLLLITGPGGCGKSSTMAALTELVNQQRYDHIVTVEEPIEYLFESKNCNVNQRHVRVHTESFASALRSAMRADPDVIIVGEMRDLETISMAVTAAETGHLVMGTLHTTNAIRSVDRIIDVFPPKEQDQIRAMVSESLRGVISQQLVPRADGLGREPALEVMFATSAVANMIRERKTFQLLSVLQTGRNRGMCTMDDSIQELLNKGVITREQAIFRAEDPARFRN